jgi:hypothetical protein
VHVHADTCSSSGRQSPRQQRKSAAPASRHGKARHGKAVAQALPALIEVRIARPHTRGRATCVIDANPRAQA